MILTAAGGTASDSLFGLFGGGNGTWSFAPQIRLPIFDGGRNQAAFEVAQASGDIAIAQCDMAVPTAFRQVADPLANRQTLSDRLAAQISLRDASQRTFDLSTACFKLGMDNYLSVLGAQRSLYSVQKKLIGLVSAEQANRVALHWALGGGAGGGAVQPDSAKPGALSAYINPP